MNEMVGIDVKQVLHMNDGVGETSYAKASYIQKQASSMSRSIKEEAIKEFYKMHGNTTSPKCLWIADFGCSSVELTKTSAIVELIAIVEKTCKQMEQNPPLQYQIALNDLPNNDFNTVFKSLSSFRDLFKEKMGDNFGHCFVGAFPGSFYGRLFPSNTLHFVHSSFSLHWLSQVPRGIDENKENIVIGRTSTRLVIKAYYDQFQDDFLTFLRCRSEEMVAQGVMVLTMIGRKDEELYDKESSQVYYLMALVLNDMVKEYAIRLAKVFLSINHNKYMSAQEERELQSKD